MRHGPLPLTVLLAALMVMAALHTVFPVANVVGDPWRLFGVAFIVLGGGLNIWADALFKSNRTTVKPFERSIALLDRGPFAYSRNPMYLGMVCVLAGVAVGLGSATPWVVVPVFVWQMHRRFIVSEEKMLDEAFGARYLEYKSKVRRWL